MAKEDNPIPEWYKVYDTCVCDKKCNLIRCHAKAYVCEHKEVEDVG